MNLSIVIDSLRAELTAVAELGDERVAGVARRLADTLAASLRLRLQDVLSQAALELSSKLPSGHVEVRLAGQEPELVYVEDESEHAAAPAGEDMSARITLRLPESLKAAVDAAAAREGVSVNAWLVRALARAADQRPRPQVGRRLTGYGRS
jgi:predicted DNA binding CopG/RHH family protein